MAIRAKTMSESLAIADAGWKVGVGINHEDSLRLSSVGVCRVFVLSVVERLSFGDGAFRSRPPAPPSDIRMEY